MIDVTVMKRGYPVLVRSKIGSMQGVVAHYLAARVPGVSGTLRHFLPGHGGDVWLIRHRFGGAVAAYDVSELMER